MSKKYLLTPIEETRFGVQILPGNWLSRIVDEEELRDRMRSASAHIESNPANMGRAIQILFSPPEKEDEWEEWARDLGIALAGFDATGDHTPLKNIFRRMPQK